MVDGMAQDFFHSVITGDENNSHRIIHTIIDFDSQELTHNFLCMVSVCISAGWNFIGEELRAEFEEANEKLCNRIKKYKLNDLNDNADSGQTKIDDFGGGRIQ